MHFFFFRCSGSKEIPSSGRVKEWDYRPPEFSFARTDHRPLPSERPIPLSHQTRQRSLRYCYSNSPIVGDSQNSTIRLGRPFSPLVGARVEIFHLIWSKIWAVWAVFSDNYAQNLASKWAVWAVFERFHLKKPLKNRSKPLKSWAAFKRFFLDKPLKPLILKQDFVRNCLKKTAQTAQILRGFWAVFFR